MHHLVWERWQFINLRTQGGMFVRSSGKGAARMHVSRFELVTVTNVSSTFVVGDGASWMAEIPHSTFAIGRLGLKEGWSPRADSNRRSSPYQGSAGG